MSIASAEHRRELQNQWHVQAARASRDVAKRCKQPIADLHRRERCRENFLAFLNEYTPQPFYLGFSNAHLKLIEDVQTVILERGQVVVAMPRGSGKSTILSRALLWAAVYGHRRFPVMANATDPHFKRVLKGLKLVLQTNDALLEDFPEVVWPVRELRNQAIRAPSQHFDGVPTDMEWSTDSIKLPTTELSTSRGNAGVTIAGGGILGALRGLNMTLPDGTVIRPDVLLFDDVQTRRSAESPAQTEERYESVNDCIHMAGPAKDIAALMACTVIAPDDLSDKVLDDQLCPDWKSHRVKTLISFPEDMDAWDKYNDVRRERLLGSTADPCAYYRKHRKKLDAGAEHYWPELIDPGKVSAIQSAMDMYFADQTSFFSERQNEPQHKNEAEDIDPLRAVDVCRRTREVRAGVVPTECTTLTAHIDVQGDILFWMLVGWTPEFGGHIVAYGTTPKRSQQYFTLAQLGKGNTLSKAYPGNDIDGRIKAGVIDTIQMISKDWPREDKSTLPVHRILVDGRYKTDAVNAGVRDSGCPVAIMAMGTAVGATNAPMSLWSKVDGQTMGDHWIVRPVKQRGRPLVHVDVNHWKTRVHGALSVAKTHTEAICFHKGTAARHQMAADHICAEKAIKVEAMQRTILEWKPKKVGQDNHYLDNLVGAMCAASMCGIRRKNIAGDKEKPKAPVRKIRKAAHW